MKDPGRGNKQAPAAAVIDLCRARSHFAGIMLLFEGPNSVSGIDPLAMVVFAVLAEAYVGGFGWRLTWIPHPLGWAMALAGRLERKLNRENRGRTNRLLRGVATMLFLLVPAVLIGAAVMFAARMASFGWLIEFPLLVALLSNRGGVARGQRILEVMRNEGLDAGRRAVAPYAEGDMTRRDAHGVGRALIEGGARRWIEDFLAPLLWYVLLGFVGLYAQRVLTVTRRALVLAAGRDAVFAAPALWLDRLATWPAGLLAAPLAAAACLTMGKARAGRALVLALRRGWQGKRPVVGWLLAALAGGLDLLLGGPIPDRRGDVDAPWIGSGEGRLSTGDVRRAFDLLFRAGLLAGLAVAGLVAVRFAT